MFIKRGVAALSAVALIAAITVSGCSSQSETGQVKIVVAAYPQEFLAKKLFPKADIKNLTPPGVEPHDLELSAGQIQEIATADLVVYQPGFQPAADDAIAATEPRQLVDIAVGVELLNPDGVSDPHIWLSPTAMQQMAKNLQVGLTHVTNVSPAALDTLLAELQELNSKYQTGLAQCQRRSIVTSHAAFAYLARDFNLTQISIAGLDPNNEPSAARLAEVGELIKKTGITTVFSEPQSSDAIVQTLAADYKLAVAQLDPIENATDSDDYLSIMAKNLTALKAANGCQ